MKIYAIATDELVGPEYKDLETRVCHNLGFFLSEGAVNLACVSANIKELELSDTENPEDIYYVMNFETKDYLQ